MRWRFGVVLCLFAAYIGVGCRDPLTPNIDRNQAPETWITSAPFDTITFRDENGRPTNPEPPGVMPPQNKLPVRFHLHWAGSDRDGAVAGFYWAVVETLPRPPEGQIFVPNLPGPKPQDYRFTTRRDTFFIFNVAEDISQRQHAFFIYAVDNQGKADPTPARFIFLAEDNYPPIPIFDECSCEGTVYDLVPGRDSVEAKFEKRFITDVDNRLQPTPRDTCPATSRLTFKWHAEVTVPQTVVTGFRYKLDEPRLIEVGPEVTSVVYNSGVGADTIPPSPGVKIFTLRAVDQASGTRDSTRRFQLNYAPDTWFSGPDPNSSSWRQKPNGEKFVLLGQLGAAGVTGSLMSPDSVFKLPASRPERKTFFEVWKDTLFLRAEDDTVHMNSFVAFHGGGYDKDSRYRVRVNRTIPNYVVPDGPVLREGPPNGSPIGFRSVINYQLWPTDLESRNLQTTMFPVFDPNDVTNDPQIAAYHPVIQSGRAFALLRAEDADGDVDRRITDGLELVLNVENGTATPQERAWRGKVMTFFVNRAPYFQTDSPVFRPSVAKVDTFESNFWDLRIVAFDEDPWLPQHPPGEPSPVVTLMTSIRLIGKNLSGGDEVWDDPLSPYRNQQNINLTIPPIFSEGMMTLVLTLCDCDQCVAQPGTGRCRTLEIPVYYRKTAAGEPAP